MSPRKSSRPATERKAEEAQFKSRLEQDLQNFNQAPDKSGVAEGETGLTGSVTKWRRDVLEAIDDSAPVPTPVIPEAKISASVLPAVDLRQRLRARKLRHRLALATPVILLLLYAGFYLLRLDRNLPWLGSYLPWPAAYVSGDIIWLKDVNSEVVLLKQQGAISSAEVLPYEKLVLDRLIEGRLVAQELESAGLSVPVELTAAEVQALEQDFGSREALENYMATVYKWSVDEFVARVLQPYLNRLTLFRYLSEDPAAQARAEAEIRDLRLAITQSEITFEVAAASQSDDATTAAQGGSLGWFTWGTMLPEFEAALRGLEPGEISQPVRTDFGYHLLRLDELEGQAPTDDSENATELGSVRASHIVVQVTDFDEWLKTRLESVRLVRLVPLAG